MGSQSNLLDWSTLPMLVAVFSVRYYEPDDLIDECTPLWKPDLWVAILGDAKVRYALVQSKAITEDIASAISDEDIPKHPLSRPLCSATDVRSYDDFSIWFSPLDTGVPSSRNRVYTWFSLVMVVVNIFPKAELPSHFTDIFFSNCMVNASIYMTMSNKALAAYRKSWFDIRGGIGFCLSDGNADDEELLSESFVNHFGPFAKADYRVRLIKYERLATQARPAPPTHSATSANIVNLMQNPERGHTNSDSAPGLLQEQGPCLNHHEIISGGCRTWM